MNITDPYLAQITLVSRYEGSEIGPLEKGGVKVEDKLCRSRNS